MQNQTQAGQHRFKGHDAVLARAQDAKKEISIRLIDGTYVSGVIVARDRYTVSLRIPSKGVWIYYKSAICGFSVAE
ncbi:RNA chaperone Hfq [Chromobacterium sp. ASV23]|uniref:RNA chaperone Hfq n=1 Tax=Chromobacterium sp. ASV23 TaxID=2795110 RepID=UPI0018ECBE5B|nr:RNA chaperone Hfq [Chromobacterium sp. ASV23]